MCGLDAKVPHMRYSTVCSSLLLKFIEYTCTVEQSSHQFHLFQTGVTRVHCKVAFDQYGR